MSWGDDVILTDARYFLPHVARAMTYCDMFKLPRDELLRSVEHFPVSRRALRKAAIKLALRRHMLHHAKMVRQKTGVLKENSGDLLDKVHSATAHLSATQAKQAKSIAYATQLEEQQSAMRRAGTAGGGHAGGAVPPAFVAEVTDGMRELRADMKRLHEEVSRISLVLANSMVTRPSQPERPPAIEP